MSEMVRKQIYITKRQEKLLKRISEARGVSEAEIVRKAIDQELYGASSNQFPVSQHTSALDDFILLARQQRDLTGAPLRYKRSDLYVEREQRWTHQIAEEDEDASSVD